MKHDYDKILTRLTSILQRLYEGEQLSVSELSTEFNVSTKTIQRDFNERLIHFPIEKVGRYWAMMPGHHIEKIRLPQELMVLTLIQTQANSIGGEFARLTHTLLNKLKNKTVDRIESKTLFEDIFDDQELFLTLEKAINLERIVTFSYNQKVRMVRPCTIVNFEGYWYLYGFELLSERLKTYHFKSIEALSITDDSHECLDEALPALHNALNAWFEPHAEVFEVTLHATKEIAKYFSRKPFPTQRIITHYEDGAIDLVIDVTSHKEVLHEIKKWIPNLLVRSPKPLALEVRKMAQEFTEAQINMVLE